MAGFVRAHGPLILAPEKGFFLEMYEKVNVATLR